MQQIEALLCIYFRTQRRALLIEQRSLSMKNKKRILIVIAVLVAIIGISLAAVVYYLDSHAIL
jgi:hypothetical protein